jgi:hypothetical protein
MENVAYCGLYCAECPNFTGIIADQARDLRKELRTYRLPCQIFPYIQMSIR